MDIIVVSKKMHLKKIDENNVKLTNALQELGQTIIQNQTDRLINIKFIEGVLKEFPNNVEVAVLITATQVSKNLGREIVEFKQNALKIFYTYGINLDKNTLAVRVNSSCNIVEQQTGQATVMNKAIANDSDEFDYEKKSKQYVPVDPAYSFERVILPKAVIEKIGEAIAILQCENKVFKEWGLYEIQPHPSTSLSFYGPPGTGKTMAAEAVAQKLGKKILKVSYADVESKFHGEGPKMVKAIFLAATNADAVLFFDEADSLLSKRLTNVSQGSEQAINSMRSQLLICLEEFRGIVIFATNLVVNYDQAFLTRLINIEFPLPDIETRKQIWDVQIRPTKDENPHQLNIPLADDVNTGVLAEKYDFVGREIRNAVISACVNVAMNDGEIVSQEDFVNACDKIFNERKALENVKDYTKKLNPAEEFMKKAVLNKIQEEERKVNVSATVEK